MSEFGPKIKSEKTDSSYLRILIQKSYLRTLIEVISEIRSKIKSVKTDSSYLRNLDPKIISEKLDISNLRI
jgi:hypothetical protein